MATTGWRGTSADNDAVQWQDLPSTYARAHALTHARVQLRTRHGRQLQLRAAVAAAQALARHVPRGRALRRRLRRQPGPPIKIKYENVSHPPARYHAKCIIISTNMLHSAMTSSATRSHYLNQNQKINVGIPTSTLSCRMYYYDN